MASYHFSVQIVKRSAGRSVVAMAAYRAGQRLHDSRRDTIEDYSRRKGVAHREIMAPDGCDGRLLEREALWNSVEAAEKRRDAQLAREINLALPHELTHEQRLELLRTFVAEQFVSRGMIADIAIHQPVLEKGDNPLNHHAHILLTLRQATAHGLRAVKTREWNSDDMLVQWRAAWSAAQNEALERYGHRAVVDHRSLDAQRVGAEEMGDFQKAMMLARAPEIHVGPKARQLVALGREVRSRVREVGPVRVRVRGQPPERRTRKYPEQDKGSRVGFLTSLLLGNNRQARERVARIDRRLDQLQQKLDRWEIRAKYGLDHAIIGDAFRRDRAIAAQRKRLHTDMERARKAHAARRVAQIKHLMRLLGGLARALSGKREGILERYRDVEDWKRRLSQSLNRHPQNRGQAR